MVLHALDLSIIVAAGVAISGNHGEDVPSEEIPWWDLEAETQGESNVAPPKYDWPAFTNWDCVGARRVTDWDKLYRQIVAGVRGELGNGSGEGAAVSTDAVAGGGFFALPEEAIEFLSKYGAQARDECPLGTLYFLTLYTYELLIESGGGDAAVRQTKALVDELRRYPFFIIAGSRWPVFEALNYFAHMHEPQSEKAKRTTQCEGVRGRSGVDWDAVLVASQGWSEEQLQGLEPGQGNGVHGQTLKAAADTVYQDHSGKGAAAQIECPFGFLFLCTTQILAASMRLTGAFEPWCRALDRLLAELPFFSIAASGWPTYRMLAFFAGLSKGAELPILKNFQADVHRFGPAHPVAKRFRQFGDLRLGAAELVGPWGGVGVDHLVELDAESWLEEVSRQKIARHQTMVEAVEAIAYVLGGYIVPQRRECGHSGITAEDCQKRKCVWAEPFGVAKGVPRCQRGTPNRKVVGVTFVWGERWARLVPKFVAWASRLDFGTIVVAMGDACRTACEAAVAALGGAGSAGVACWDPLRLDAEAVASGGIGQIKARADRGSILQRHALVHLLLHVGIDALAFDFDTFFFRDPRQWLQTLAENTKADILMARHLDADCLNMGLLYIRASERSSQWYKGYLAWLHQHPYEREQRGVNSILRFTKQKVSFPPKNLPLIRAVAVDDYNEFASSRGGWLGDWDQLRFFHWVNPMQTRTDWSDVKVNDLHALYEAALHPGWNHLSVGGSLASMLAQAEPGHPHFAARTIMESMRVLHPPERKECW